MDQPVPVPVKKASPVLIIIAVVVVVSGTLAGYFLANKPQKTKGVDTAVSQDLVNTATVVGSNDTKTFSDVATGTLEKGGIKGEGTHHLTRSGGDSQTVYLISSIVDLDQFVGKQVEINGQTLKGRYSGWLMDVGRVKVLE